MTSSRILIAYYSRTGNTARVAHDLRQMLRERGLACDVEELTEARPRAGVRGYLESVLDSILDRSSALLPLEHNPAEYALVVIGTPIWNGNVSTPVRTFLRAHAGQARHLAWFLTYRGSGRDRVLRRIVRLAGKPAIATVAVREAELSNGRHHRAIELFAERLAVGLQAESGASAPRAVVH